MSWEDMLRKGVKAIAAQAKSIKDGLGDDELSKAKEELDAYLAERTLGRAEKTQSAFNEMEQKMNRSAGQPPLPAATTAQDAAQRPVNLASILTPPPVANPTPAASVPVPPTPTLPPVAPAITPPLPPVTPVTVSPPPVTATPVPAPPPPVATTPVPAPPAPTAPPPAVVTVPPAPAATAPPVAVEAPPVPAPPVPRPPTQREKFLQDLKALLQGDFPIITVITAESTNSARDIQAAVEGVAMKHIAQENIVEFQKIAQLLLNPSEVRSATTLVIRDAQLYAENKNFVRGLRQLKTELPNQPRRVKVILQSFGDLTLPGDLRYLPTLYYPLPDRADLQELIARMAGFIRDRYKFPVNVDAATGERLANLLLGQTYEQATETLLRTALQAHKLDASVLAEIEAEKFKGLSSSTLNYINVSPEAAQIGGFENFRQFLELAHRTGVGEEALARGHEPVKGVVMVGIPGAGKSQGAYMAASVLNLPLFRANLDTVLGKYVGESESGMRDALRQIDALGPSVIWIDEIEKALSGGSSESGVQTKLNGIMLTWLQENKKVFIYATANDITRLPPEILRSGRLDKTFFVSLPNAKERALIFSIHLKKRGLDPARFDLERLARQSEGYVGGEIEQAVKDAFREFGHDLTTAQVEGSLENVVPLSVSRAEDIRALEEWGATRAVSVSGDGTDSLFRAGLLEWVPVDPECEPATKVEPVVPSAGQLQEHQPPAPEALRGLRDWIDKRKHLYGEQAQRLGLPPPQGIFVVGVPGTDQRGVAEAVAQELARRLLKIGTERLQSDTETKLQTIDRVLQNQDLVVWVDEAPPELAERLIAWLSRYPQVFTVFTTNDPGHQLPRSLQRGRISLTENRGLNEVFFVDLPDRAQLVSIFHDLLARHHVSPAGIDLDQVATDAQGFSAQEAALVVEDALIETLSDNGRPLTASDLIQALHMRVPGAKVRSEEIDTIRSWAEQHARRA